MVLKIICSVIFAVHLPFIGFVMIHSFLIMEVLGFVLFGWSAFGLVFLPMMHP